MSVGEEEIVELLAKYSWWYKLYRKTILAPWWLSYKLGFSPQSTLNKKIASLADSLGLDKRLTRELLNYAITEFSLKGLGASYYGYHTIDHELEATYIALLAAGKDEEMTYKDRCYLFVAALFHDFDPLKDFDKPNEEAVEWFIRHDRKMQELIKSMDLDLNIVIALIYRTAFPFKGEIREEAMRRIDQLLTNAGVDKERKHYYELGWFLSVSERIAGYALGDFKKSLELALRNAHALGWHPSVINRESVTYFDILLNEEKEMLERIINNIPEEYRNNFYNNVSMFKKAWEKEVAIKNMVLQNKIKLTPAVCPSPIDPETRKSVIKLYTLLPSVLRISTAEMSKSLSSNDTLLVILRTNSNENESIVGYAKGGPLERYKLRKGTNDENLGRRNTIYLEPMSIVPGYWASNGGHLMRAKFIMEAKRQGYKYLSAYTHRKVIERRIARGEPLEIICRYDPDKLDYYRLALSNIDEDMLQEGE